MGECLMFLQAVIVATLIAAFFAKNIETPFKVFTYSLAWAEWPFMLFWLIPRLVSRLTVLSSVEYERDGETVDKVIAKVKAHRVAEMLRMLRIIRLEILNGIMGNEEKIKEVEKSISKLPEEKRTELNSWFNVFDADGDGKISPKEVKGIYKSLGHKDHLQEHADRLFQIIDRNGDGFIDLDEFRIMTLFAMGRESTDDERQSLVDLYHNIDEDHSDSVGLEELGGYFEQLGVDLDSDDLGGLVYKCFGEVKMALTCEEFIDWVVYCQKEASFE